MEDYLDEDCIVSGAWELGALGKVRVWRLNGYLHRVDGPAIMYSKTDYQFWLNGKRYYSKESYFNDSAEKNKERLLYSAEFMSGGKESVDESESLSKMVWNFGVEI